MEEVEEEFKLIEEDEWHEVEHVVLLVVDCIGDSIVGFGSAVQPHLPFYVHLLASAAPAANEAAEALATASPPTERLPRASHLRFGCAVLIPRPARFFVLAQGALVRRVALLQLEVLLGDELLVVDACVKHRLPFADIV